MLKKLSSTGLSWLWITVLIMTLDRFSKIWVTQHLAFYEPYPVLPFFNLTLAYNTGAAFSFLHTMPGWQNWFLGSLAVIVSMIIIYWLIKTPARARWLNISLCLILAGALGNAWDRALYRYVIDFLDFHWGDWHFAIFNIADSAVSVGGFMLFLYWLYLNRKNSS